MKIQTIIGLFAMAAVLLTGMAAVISLAIPADADINCRPPEGTVVTCTGGLGEQHGGTGGKSVVDLATGEFTTSGGSGSKEVSGGGHCTGDFGTGENNCVGSGEVVHPNP